MSYLPLVKPELEKVLNAVQKDRSLLVFPKSAGSDDDRITVENLADIACGGFFCESTCQRFGITKDEGHKIRYYFQTGITYDFVSELHNTYPDIFEPERKEFLDRINSL